MISRPCLASKSATARPTVPLPRPITSSRPRPTVSNALHMGNDASTLSSDDVPLLTRRVLFITLPMAPVLLRALKARADEPDNGFKKFVGALENLHASQNHVAGAAPLLPKFPSNPSGC